MFGVEEVVLDSEVDGLVDAEVVGTEVELVERSVVEEVVGGFVQLPG